MGRADPSPRLPAHVAPPIVYPTFWATVTSNGSPYATGPLSYLSCLSVRLSVTLVYCGQTVGWTKMPLGTEIGLGQGDTVSVWTQLPPTERGTVAPHFRPVSIVTKRWSISATAELLLDLVTPVLLRLLL